MQTTTVRIVCEVCGLGSPRAAWRENRGYCPNCHQPCGPHVIRALEDIRTYPEPDDDEIPPTYQGSLDIDDRYV